MSNLEAVLLGLSILGLLDAWVVVLGAVGLRGAIVLARVVVLEILVIDVEGLLNLLAKGILILGAAKNVRTTSNHVR